MKILGGKDKRNERGKFVPNEYFYNGRINAEHFFYGN